jgi:hypothetical protein
MISSKSSPSSDPPSAARARSSRVRRLFFLGVCVCLFCCVGLVGWFDEWDADYVCICVCVVWIQGKKAVVPPPQLHIHIPMPRPIKGPPGALLDEGLGLSPERGSGVESRVRKKIDAHAELLELLLV